MPNHFHGIINIVGTPLVGVHGTRNNNGNIQEGQAQGQSVQIDTIQIKRTVGDIIGGFKSITTNQYSNGGKLGLIPTFYGILLAFLQHLSKTILELVK